MTTGESAVTDAAAGPLAGERVLDLSGGVAGAFCAKLLGDLGADVVKVDAPPGGSLRPDGHDARARAEWLYFNTSKRSVVLDIDTPDGREVLGRLVAARGVVIADGPESNLADRGVGWVALKRWHPSAILTTISGFGSDGPYAGYRSSHLITCALSGWAAQCGLPDREPLQAGRSLTERVSGAYAAVATLGAIEARARHGYGDHVDVSDWEAAITCALGPSLVYEYLGLLSARRSDVMTGPSYNLRCRDGYVGVNVLTEAQWQTLCAFVGRPDLADDPRMGQYWDRALYVDEIRAALEQALADRGAAEIFHDAQLWRLPFGLVASPADALALVPHAERDYFERHDDADGGTVLTPRAPFLMAATPSRPRPAPRFGQHTEEVLAELGRPDGAPLGGAVNGKDARTTPEAPPALDGSRPAPLAGLRVVDLTMFMSGPLTTLLAADLGADVIKVEAVQRLDGWRGSGRGGERPWENAPLWNWINRTKRGITLDLTQPRGAELLVELAAVSDVVIENYTPRVMHNFGLGFDQLRAANPNLIMLSMPGFGGAGSWRDYAAFAWTTEQLGMICHLTGYEGGEPLFTGTTGGDPLAGLMGALALLAALNHRRRTGTGQHVDLSQVETATAFVADALVEAQLTGTIPTRQGNRHHAMAPHGMYPCRDGRWIAVACRSDAEWQALWSAMGRPRAGEDGRLGCASLAERCDMAERLDADLAAWTHDQDAGELMHRLQAVGVTAALVMNGKDLLEDAHLRARRFFLTQDRQDIGVKHYPGQPFRFAEGTLAAPARAPYVGEHNRDVLCGLLGVSEALYAELERDRVIGTAPLGV